MVVMRFQKECYKEIQGLPKMTGVKEKAFPVLTVVKRWMLTLEVSIQGISATRLPLAGTGYGTCDVTCIAQVCEKTSMCWQHSMVPRSLHIIVRLS